MANTTVFLVDDHAVVRDGLAALINSQRKLQIVGSADDGKEAIRRIPRIKPDIVLMDISMPTLNGIDATPQILKNSPGTRVIILSMYDDIEHIFRALKAGAQGYLLKESAGQEVIQAIRKVYSGERYLSQKVSSQITDDLINNRVHAEKHNPLDLLSIRERETLRMVVEGKSSHEISKMLFLSQKTVETYRSRLMDKLGIHDIPGLVKFAIQNGITYLD
jgi:DNA-binding NarL/FixJ family response regulator